MTDRVWNSPTYSTVSDKIQRQHREWLAMVYVRQSTMEQVERHQESTRLQYALVDGALHMGWNRSSIVVVDDDVGRSGASIEGRPGYQPTGISCWRSAGPAITPNEPADNMMPLNPRTVWLGAPWSGNGTGVDRTGAGRDQFVLVHADVGAIATARTVRATPAPWRRLPPPITAGSSPVICPGEGS